MPEEHQDAAYQQKVLDYVAWRVRQKQLARQRAYYWRNREARLAYDREYYRKNREAKLTYARAYYLNKRAAKAHGLPWPPTPTRYVA